MIDDPLTCQPDVVVFVDILSLTEHTEGKILLGHTPEGSVIHHLPVAALLQPNRVLAQMLRLDIHLISEVPLAHRAAEVSEDAAPMLTTPAVNEEHLGT